MELTLSLGHFFDMICPLQQETCEYKMGGVIFKGKELALVV